MNPDTLIFHIAGAQCRLDVTQDAVVYLGSDVRTDVYLQSSQVAPVHCAIKTLANDQFRVVTLDGTPSLTINGEPTHDMTVKAPFVMVIAEYEIDVRLESIEKKKAETVAAPNRGRDASIPIRLAGAAEESGVQESRPSFFSMLIENGHFTRRTKIALGAVLTLGGFCVVDRLWPGDGDVIVEMQADTINLEDFLRKFTLGPFRYTITSAERVSFDEDDDFNRHFADSSGPWNGPAEEKPDATSIYAVRMEVTNLDDEKPQPFVTEFALTNLSQLNCHVDEGATQLLMHQHEIKPMPNRLEPGASHECVVAFQVPNVALHEMIILIASEKRLLKRIEARIGLNTQALAETILKIAKTLSTSVAQKMVSIDQMNRPETTTSDGLLIPLGNGSSMMFRYCEGGDFIMGSPAMEEGRHASEKPTHASVSQGFWMAETECTQKQWTALVARNPSRFRGRELPVDSVTWDDAKSYVDRLNTLPHLSEVWRKTWAFALPTEAQWEYACRAGTPSSFNNGTFYSRRLRDNSPAESIAWFADNAGAATQATGTKAPNRWGLHDMHGNVWEWCQDWFYPQLIGGNDPEGPGTGTERVLRGGAFSSPESELRAARRSRLDPAASYSSIGFRVVIVKRHPKTLVAPEVVQTLPATAD